MPPSAPPDAAPAPELSVVLPVHDEADNVEPLLDEIAAALAGLIAYEIVVVDDGSADATPARLADVARRMAALRVVRHRANAGQSAALHTGVRAARGTLVATLDGDGQNDPADIPALLGAWRAAAGGPPLLIAGHRTRRRDGFVTRASSRVANAVRGALLRDRTPDTGCGLKLFPRDLFLRLPYFDHMHRFLPALAIRAGAVVRSVPVRHRPRTRGRSHYGIHNRLWVGLDDLLGVAWLMRRGRRGEPVEEPAPTSRENQP